jgi:hypothetical protein
MFRKDILLPSSGLKCVGREMGYKEGSYSDPKQE